MDDLTETDCRIDDFYQAVEPRLKVRLLTDGKRHRSRKSSLSIPELMTRVVLFHPIRYRKFKFFYLNPVGQHLRAEFPRLPTYPRCVELLPRCAIALAALFEELTGKCSGVSIADSPHRRLQELADSSPPGVPREGGARQAFDRLFFRFQTPLGHQSLRGWERYSTADSSPIWQSR